MRRSIGGASDTPRVDPSEPPVQFLGSTCTRPAGVQAGVQVPLSSAVGVHRLFWLLHTGSVLPELDVRRVQRWCDGRVPARVRDHVRVEVDIARRHLTIVETRPPWRPDLGPEWTRFPIARLRYTKTTGFWDLYWRDRSFRFHRYDRLPPSRLVDDLLAEIDRDPIRIFWG